MSGTAGGARESLRIANAPCSFGAFDLAGLPKWEVPSATGVLDEVAKAGYRGIDLGSVGYLGLGEQLHDRLEARGLLLAGGFVELALGSDEASFVASLGGLRAVLDMFDCAPPGDLAPRVTLADGGAEQRRQHPGRAATDREFGWTSEEWKKVADRVTLVLAECLDRGYEVAFHHHVGSFVEAPWEIEQMLNLTDVGLCLDTGHLVAGGGDPVPAIREWGERINQFHLKDVKADLVSSILTAGGSMYELWQRDVFCGLGRGDVKIPEAVATLVAGGYTGWLVVEQDCIPSDGSSLESAGLQQAENLRFVEALGLVG
jgi:inosose dehydratase